MARRPKIATKFIVPVDESRAEETFEFGGNSDSVDRIINGGASQPDFYHLGSDYDYFGNVAQEDQFVFAAANGQVVEIGLDDGSDSGYGNYVILKHILPGNQELYSFYGHMDEEPVVSMNEFVDIGDQLGLVGDTGFVIGEHLHFEMRFDAPTFIGSGPGKGSYDTLGQFNQGVALGDLFDPDTFVRDYSSTNALMKDFAPKGGPDLDKPQQGPRQILDFDDLFQFDTQKLIYDGFGYFGDIDDDIAGFQFENLFAIHAPSYFDQGAGYATGNTSGDWTAFNGGGAIGWIENDVGFDFDGGSFTAAWNNDLELTMIAYDLIDGSYIEKGSMTVILDTDGPTDVATGRDFRDIEKIEFISEGGTNDPDLNGFGTQFAMDDILVFI